MPKWAPTSPAAWRVGKPPPQPADAADRSSARLRSASMPLPIFGRADVVSSWPEVAASRIRCRAAWLQTLVGLENFSELKVRCCASEPRTKPKSTLSSAMIKTSNLSRPSPQTRLTTLATCARGLIVSSTRARQDLRHAPRSPSTPACGEARGLQLRQV